MAIPHGQGNYDIVNAADLLPYGDSESKADEHAGEDAADTELRHIAATANGYVAAMTPAQRRAFQAALDAAANDIQQAASAEDEQSDREDNSVASFKDPQGNDGPLQGQPGQARRARLWVSMLVGGVVSSIVGVGGGVLALAITGYFKAAPMVVPVVSSGGGGAGPTPSDVERAAVEVLKAWLNYPDDSLFNVMRAAMNQKGSEWSIAITSLVVEQLSELMDAIHDPKTDMAYAALRVPQATIDADFATLKAAMAGLTPVAILDRSAAYPDPVATSKADLAKYGRAVRLAYMNALLAKAITEWMAANAGT